MPLLDLSLIKGSSLHIGLYCTQVNIIIKYEKIFLTLKKKTFVLASKSIWVAVNTLRVEQEKISSQLLGKYESPRVTYVESAETVILFCQDVRTLYISLRSFSHRTESHKFVFR